MGRSGEMVLPVTERRGPIEAIFDDTAGVAMVIVKRIDSERPRSVVACPASGMAARPPPARTSGECPIKSVRTLHGGLMVVGLVGKRSGKKIVNGRFPVHANPADQVG